MILHNGRIQPAQSQSWFGSHSSGYHTEYGIFQAASAADFDAGWKNRALQLDPTNVVAALAKGQAPTWPGSSGGQGSQLLLDQNSSTTTATSQNSCPESHWYNPISWAASAACNAETTIADQVAALVQKVMLFLLGLALIIVGFWLLVSGSGVSDTVTNVALEGPIGGTQGGGSQSSSQGGNQAQAPQAAPASTPAPSSRASRAD